MGDLLGRITSRRHGDPAVGVLQRKNIIDTVADHADHIPVGLIGLNNPLLLLRTHTAIDRIVRHDLPKFLKILRQRIGINVFFAALQSGLNGNIGNRHRIITGNHLNINILAGKIFKCVMGFRTDTV